MMTKPHIDKANTRFVPDENLVQVGLIRGVHGVKGMVKIISYTDPADNLFDYMPVFDQHQNKLNVTPSNMLKGSFLCRIEGVNDRNQAEKLQNTAIYIKRDQLPAPKDDDEFYHCDLMGLSVVDDADHHLGSIVSVQNYGAEDLLEIAVDLAADQLVDGKQVLAGRILLPFTKENVPQIDMRQARIKVQRPAFDQMLELSNLLVKLDAAQMAEGTAP
ncbi:MAG: ribosome maturation factor RimM [Alphaproteobacteria bacterium]